MASAPHHLLEEPESFINHGVEAEATNEGVEGAEIRGDIVTGHLGEKLSGSVGAAAPEEGGEERVKGEDGGGGHVAEEGDGGADVAVTGVCADEGVEEAIFD